MAYHQINFFSMVTSEPVLCLVLKSEFQNLYISTLFQYMCLHFLSACNMYILSVISTMVFFASFLILRIFLLSEQEVLSITEYTKSSFRRSYDKRMQLCFCVAKFSIIIWIFHSKIILNYFDFLQKISQSFLRVTVRNQRNFEQPLLSFLCERNNFVSRFSNRDTSVRLGSNEMITLKILSLPR